jgi:hypothetical protein
MNRTIDTLAPVDDRCWRYTADEYDEWECEPFDWSSTPGHITRRHEVYDHYREQASDEASFTFWAASIPGTGLSLEPFADTPDLLIAFYAARADRWLAEHPDAEECTVSLTVRVEIKGGSNGPGVPVVAQNSTGSGWSR